MAQVDNIIGYVKGPQGDAASISVGNVSTGAAGSSASVTNRGTSSAAVLDFTIPKGEKGDAGTPGVSSYASESEAGLVRAGDDILVNSSNGILSLNSNNITEPSEVTNLVSGDSYRTILGKIKKFISTFSSNNFLINALTSSATDKARTANMGRALANNIATIETSSTASRAYSIGEHLIYGGQLYTVTAAIVSGGTLTVGTNIEASKLADELTSSISAHSGDIATIETTNTASRNYTVGKLIILGNQLYRTTAAIATGATLEVGTNIEVTNLGDQISSLNDSLANSLGTITITPSTSGDIAFVKAVRAKMVELGIHAFLGEMRTTLSGSNYQGLATFDETYMNGTVIRIAYQTSSLFKYRTTDGGVTWVRDEYIASNSV